MLGVNHKTQKHPKNYLKITFKHPPIFLPNHRTESQGKKTSSFLRPEAHQESLELLQSLLESLESCDFSAFWPRVVESAGAVVEPSNHPTIHLTQKTDGGEVNHNWPCLKPLTVRVPNLDVRNRWKLLGINGERIGGLYKTSSIPHWESRWKKSPMDPNH